MGMQGHNCTFATSRRADAAYGEVAFAGQAWEEEQGANLQISNMKSAACPWYGPDLLGFTRAWVYKRPVKGAV